MNAAIITIGDEILIGQITDTNSVYIAKELNKIGVSVNEIVSISDQKEHILKTLKNYQDKVDFIFITGGLGPTKDDVTKTTFCEYFNDTLVEDKEVLAHVTHIIENIMQRPITPINKAQALVPSKAKVIFNKVGTAPCMYMQQNKTTYISLPGVPFEMKYIIDNEIIPLIKKKYKRPYIIHKTLLTYGVGESLLAEQLENIENNLPQTIKLAYLPSPGRVRLRLSAKGDNKENLEKDISNVVNAISEILKDVIIGFNEDETLDYVVANLLKLKNKTLATAESCTGGKIAQILTATAGASAYFKGSVVAYATQSKTDILNIDEEIIKKYSVVSKEVATEMALQAKKIFNTDYTIATTGNAGPLKGDSQKEVGTVCIAIASPKKIICEEFNFGNVREKVIDKAVNKAFEMLRKEILKN